VNTVLDTENPTPVQADMELHIRVQPPTNGFPNIISFGHFSALPATDATWQLEIAQYNSFLSVSDNGRNDKLELVQQFSQQPAIYI
jgi:hypothetical protein